jgi:N-acyl-D-amino-acid deacylase
MQRQLWRWFAVLAIGILPVTVARAAEQSTEARAGTATSTTEAKSAEKAAPLPTTGAADSRLTAFDELFQSFMAEHKVPGAALAIMRDGKLIYDRGYGYANTDTQEPVQPQSRFRIASISKPITAVAILQLVEQGKLKLDDRILDIIGIEPYILSGGELDPRMRDVTVRHCLQHTGGWDRSKSRDPMFSPWRIARMLDLDPPPSAKDAVRYMLGQKLDFAPGEKYAYANIDYCILGRLIEKVTGMTYDEYVKQNVLAPLGIQSMQLGRTLADQRADREVCYYHRGEQTRSVFSMERFGGPRVPNPYGGFCIEWMDSHGGWISTASDLVRFAASFDDPAKSRILKADSIATMRERPSGAPGEDNGQPATRFYGCGWFVRTNAPGGGSLGHTGALDGTSTVLLHRNDGYNVAVLFNARLSKDNEELVDAFMPGLHRTIANVSDWPTLQVKPTEYVAFAASTSATKPPASKSTEPPQPPNEFNQADYELKQSRPTTGKEVAQLKAFDDLMQSFMDQHKLPGGSLAVMRNGKLLYSRGFGYSDVAKKEPVQTDSLFRIASISKPFTAVAIMRLVEKGKLSLDDRVFDLLDIEPFIEKDTKPDPRVKLITVRHCLQHTSGWDRGKSYDAMFIPFRIARSMKIDCPPEMRDIIRYMQGQPLDFSPGEQYAYSNLGYMILGRIIEKLTGVSYEEHMQKEILRPLGITDMRMGRSLLDKRAPKEVRYYASGETAVAVMGPRYGMQVPKPYGPFYFETMDSHGAWIATAEDLVKFSAAFDNYEKCPLLKPVTIATMFARPTGLAGYDEKGNPKDEFYGCGWRVFPEGDGKGSANHAGALDGTSTLMLHRNDGINMAVLFNYRFTIDKKPLSTAIMPLLHKTANDIREWPEAAIETSTQTAWGTAK